jgi:hypothetical protein
MSITSGSSSFRRPGRSRPGRLRRRLARWHAWHLDTVLAAGASPAPGTLLGAHAAGLNELSSRWDLASAWRNLLALVDGDDAPSRWSVRPLSAAVTTARCEIEQLIAALYSLEPVNPRGVALARLLVRDGTGPVYNPASEEALIDAVDECLRALDATARPPRRMPRGNSSRVEQPGRRIRP